MNKPGQHTAPSCSRLRDLTICSCQHGYFMECEIQGPGARAAGRSKADLLANMTPEPFTSKRLPVKMTFFYRAKGTG